MNWEWFDRNPPILGRERGRPWPRLVRGVLWALVAIFVFSILAFWFGQWVIRSAIPAWQ